MRGLGRHTFAAVQLLVKHNGGMSANDLRAALGLPADVQIYKRLETAIKHGMIRQDGRQYTATPAAIAAAAAGTLDSVVDAPGANNPCWQAIAALAPRYPAGITAPQAAVELPDFTPNRIASVMSLMAQCGALHRATKELRRGMPWFFSAESAAAWRPAARHKPLQSAPAHVLRPASGRGKSIDVVRPSHYAILTAADRAQFPAVVPEGVKVQVGPCFQYDPRYQCDPKHRVVGGFATAGIGRYLDESEAA